MPWARLNVNAKLQVNARVIERTKEHARAKSRQVTAHTMRVGIPEEEGDQPKVDYRGKEGAATVAQVAIWLEFGTDVIPARPFVTTWFDSNRDRLQREMTAAMRAEYRGNADAVARLGAKWADEQRQWLLGDQAHSEPLKPSTVRAKSNAGLSQPGTPDVATRQIAKAITSMEGRR